MTEINTLLGQPQVYIPMLVWSLFWKGRALWKAATKRQLVWFGVLLIANTLGLLEIAYIYYLNRWDIDNGKTLKWLEKKFGQTKS